MITLYNDSSLILDHQANLPIYSITDNRQQPYILEDIKRYYFPGLIKIHTFSTGSYKENVTFDPLGIRNCICIKFLKRDLKNPIIFDTNTPYQVFFNPNEDSEIFCLGSNDLFQLNRDLSVFNNAITNGLNVIYYQKDGRSNIIIFLHPDYIPSRMTLPDLRLNPDIGIRYLSGSISSRLYFASDNIPYFFGGGNVGGVKIPKGPVTG